MVSIKRSRNPPGEGSRLRDELIEAAGRVLAEMHATDFSLRAVAREAGVAAPSVYLQFADKADLVSSVYYSYFEQLRQAIVHAISEASGPAERLRAGCLSYCRFGMEHSGAYRVLFQLELSDARPRGPFGGPEDAGARAFATLVDAIDDCMTAGVAPPGDPFRQATLVWASMHGYVSLVRATPGFPWPPVEEYVEDLVVGIVGVPRQRPSVGSGMVPGREQPRSNSNVSTDPDSLGDDYE